MAESESEWAVTALHLVSRQCLGAALRPPAAGRRWAPMPPGCVRRLAGRMDRPGPDRAPRTPVDPRGPSSSGGDRRRHPFGAGAARSEHDQPGGLARRALARVRPDCPDRADRGSGIRRPRGPDARGDPAGVGVVGRAGEDRPPAPRTDGPAGVRARRPLALCRAVFHGHQSRWYDRRERSRRPLSRADRVHRGDAGRRPPRAAHRDVVELRVPGAFRRSLDRDVFAGREPRRVLVAAGRRSPRGMDDADARERDRRRGHAGRGAAPHEPASRSRDGPRRPTARDAGSDDGAPRARRISGRRVLRRAGGHAARRGDGGHLAAVTDARRATARRAPPRAGSLDGGVSPRGAGSARRAAGRQGRQPHGGGSRRTSHGARSSTPWAI